MFLGKVLRNFSDFVQQSQKIKIGAIYKQQICQEGTDLSTVVLLRISMQ